jgi:hypothetical protein
VKALSLGLCPYAYFFFAFADFFDDLPFVAAAAASSGTTPPAALRQPTGRPRFLGAEPGAGAAFAAAGALDGAGDFVAAAFDTAAFDTAAFARAGTTPPAALRQPTGRPRFLGAEPGAGAAFAAAGALGAAGDFAAAAFASSGTTPPAALRQPTGRPRFLGAAPGTADFGVAGFFDDEAFAGAADFTGRTTA